MIRLPIDDVLHQIVEAVRTTRTCVLVAPPGAGKTTRVPVALLEVCNGAIVVLQPRRLAARLAATRIAQERGSELGGEVGYQVRFDRKVSAATRIELVTEGVLTRRLLNDPQLKGVGCVVIDEFHERHLDGDLALAMVARLRQTRPELALVVMSATLDAEPVAQFLNAPIVRSEGRTFPLTIEYADGVDDRQLGKQVSAAVRRVAQQGLDGDVLVFLPGTGEIRRCAEDLEDAARTFDLAVMPLHGELSADEQDAAVRPASRRKVILATNVAETSVTIDGVTAVIDSGLARVAKFSPWSGIPSLEISPISRASAAQRAGRAGRTRPGRVIRLYTKHDHDTRRAFDAPEVSRSDLAGVALELHGAGIDPAGLTWFEAPPQAAIDAASTVLKRLGAVDGAITKLGRAMLRFPVHPRVARMLCECEARGVAKEGAVIAGLLGVRELRVSRRGPGAQAQLSSPSDLIDDLDAFLDAQPLRADRLRRDGLDVATAFGVDRAAKQLDRLVDKSVRPPGDDAAVDRELMIAILTAYPDRVGKRRAPKSPEIVFAAGGSGVLAPSSAVLEPELVVAVDVADTGTKARAQIRRASAVDASWLLDLYLDRVEERDELVWNAERQRVERVQQMTYDGLAIDEQRDVEGARRAGPAAAALLAKQAVAAGIERFVDRDALNDWKARIAFVAKAVPESGITPLSDEEVIATAADGCISFAELREANLLALLDAGLGDKKKLVDRFAPTHLGLPRRGRVQIHYELDQPPWLASRMQDFFGLARAPSVADGRVPLVLHLLAPNQRPVQVTTDLPGFWIKHYPALRKQLMRRYPRHQWPEDPTQLIKED
ncbi:MAG: ATP-dependent helicase HrpB [Kofleriaceae bacterium]